MREGSKDLYAQEETSMDSKLVPEGIEGRVPYKGTMADMVTQLIGGLKSGMGYTGCRTIAELKINSCFIRITSAGLRESHVHDVIITKEAPNYRLEWSLFRSRVVIWVKKLMPVALRVRGYRFFFFSLEGTEPPHIHIEQAERVAKFWLNPVSLVMSRGFRSNELPELQRIVQENLATLMEKWNEHFGH
jgi:hypothetical protein